MRIEYDYISETKNGTKVFITKRIYSAQSAWGTASYSWIFRIDELVPEDMKLMKETLGLGPGWFDYSGKGLHTINKCKATYMERKILETLQIQTPYKKVGNVQ